MQLLTATRPEPALIRPTSLPHSLLEVRWDHDNTVDTWLCTWISLGGADRCALGFYQSDHEGTFPMFLRFAEREPVCWSGVPAEVAGAFERIVDHGQAAEGPVRWSFYLYGADLEALRRAGVSLSPPAARYLRQAIRQPLVRLHSAGLCHGALTARRIRLALAPEPYREDGWPIRLCAPRFAPLGPGDADRELAVLDGAIAALTRRADPEAPLGPSEPLEVDPAELAALWASVARADPLVRRIFPAEPRV